jgi:hypothetical protein
MTTTVGYSFISIATEREPCRVERRTPLDFLAVVYKYGGIDIRVLHSISPLQLLRDACLMRGPYFL